MDPMVIAPSPRFCNKTQMRWQPAASCAPITQNEMQCKGKDGIFSNLPQIPGTFTAWTLDASHFKAAPFELSVGDELVCRARSQSVKGWSEWSEFNEAVKIPNCDKEVVQLAEEFWKEGGDARQASGQ